MSLCNLAKLNISDAIATVPSTRISIGESAHPDAEGDRTVIRLFAVDNALSYLVSFDGWTDEVESVHFCKTATCTDFGANPNDIYGVFENFDYPGKTDFVAEVMYINASTFYMIMGLRCVKTEEALGLCWGYEFHVEATVANRGWRCTSPKQAGARAQSLSIEGSKSLSLTHEFMSPRRKFAELGAAASDDSYAENYCEWTGVTCDADEEVISIILESYGMSGTLPDIFTSFTRMHTLDLSGNELSGTLPSSISKLISLETLDLSSNLLNGNISVLSHLNPETMKFVYLYGNFLSGSIPAELDALKKLDSLILSNNDFSGKLAQEMCDLSTTYVDVSGNEMDCYDPCWEDASAEQFKGGTLSICAPTSVPTSQPSRPTMAPSGELLSSLTYDELATIFSMSGTTFFVVIILCSYMFIYKPRIDYVKKRDLALEVLPIHSAIVHGHSEEKILALIKEHQETLNFRDYDNKTAFDWCVEYGSSDDLVQAIVEACLPLPQGDSVYPPPPDMHGFVWATVVQYDQYADVVEKVLTAHAEQALDLARSRDEEGRSAMNIASPENHTILHSFLHFYRQYELIMAPTESVFYKSESSIIQLAIDHGIRGQNNTPVALKFIAKRDDFNRECYTRAMIELDDEYVVPFIRVHDSDIDNNFLRAVRHCDMGNYPYCVVMPVGERTLKTIMMTEHIAGTEWHQIKLITSQLAVAIKHIHDRGFTHGDVSPSNIVRMGGKMKLIDLDSSAILGSGFSNTKKSTAHLPPEMFFDTGKEVLCRRVVMNATNMPYSLVPAAVSHDVWSMGMVLFELFTGFPFFLADVDENLDQEDMRDLLNFEDGYKFDKLKAIKQPLARNFLSEILVRDPAKRPTMDTILMHPFMTGEFKRKVGAELHDVVIAYRSGDDISIAERVAEELRAKGLTVWYKDMPGIPPDQSMELLNDAMMNCRVYTPILTRNSINNPTDKSRNFAELKQKDRDGYLHQMWFALELKARGFINEIYPLLSGDVDPATGSVRHYFASGSHPNVTKLDFVLLREEKDVNDQLDDLGLGTPLLENMTVKQIMNDVTQHQGSIPQGPFQQAFNGAVDDMVKICERQEIKNRESMASRATEVSRPSEVYGLSRSSSAVSDADAVALQMPAAEIGDPGFAGDVEMQTMNPIVSSLLKSTNKSKKSNKAGGGGLKKGHDVVIVVGEEAGLAIASQLNMYLARAGLKCWMQSYASAQVMDLKFMDDFIDVIKGAPVFLPVFTRGAIKDPPNGAADAYADALLYALRLSYELLALNHLGSIFPVWVGDVDTESSGPGTSIIIDYFASKCLPTLQDGVVDQRAEMKVSAMFMKHNLGRQKSDRMEVKSLIEQVIEMQGHRFKGDLDESFEDVVEGVTELIEDLGASWGFSFN
jgi:serine/threonine protein kinase